MAGKISISTSDLIAQSNRLAKLGTQMDDITAKADRALSLIENALSSKFSSNMGKKGKTLLKNLKSLKSSLKTGADVAKKCAESYENADKVLRNVIGDSLPNDVKNSAVSEQTVLAPFENKVHEMKQKENFEQGTHWGNENSFTGSSWGCVAMANEMQKELMGRYGENINVNSINDIIEGDIITYSNEYTDPYWGHTVCILGKTERGFLIGEGNYTPYLGKDALGNNVYGDPIVNYRELSYKEIGELKCVRRVV